MDFEYLPLSPWLLLVQPANGTATAITKTNMATSFRTLLNTSASWSSLNTKRLLLIIQRYKKTTH